MRTFIFLHLYALKEEKRRPRGLPCGFPGRRHREPRDPEMRHSSRHGAGSLATRKSLTSSGRWGRQGAELEGSPIHGAHRLYSPRSGCSEGKGAAIGLPVLKRPAPAHWPGAAAHHVLGAARRGGWCCRPAAPLRARRRHEWGLNLGRGASHPPVVGIAPGAGRCTHVAAGECKKTKVMVTLGAQGFILRRARSLG